MFDHISGYIYLLRKDHDNFDADVYKFKPDFSGSNSKFVDIELEKLGTMHKKLLTAGDISQDGGLIAMKNYEQGWIYYR